MSYHATSNWNDVNELKCLIIYKKLDKVGFPYGMRMKLCKEICKDTGLEARNISAKVGNFRTVAGEKNSNPSRNTEKIYQKYNKYSIDELNLIIKEKNI